MNPISSTIQNLFGARTWRSSLQLLIALAILCWASAAQAQSQTETWLGAASGTSTWTNKAGWTPQGVSSNGDALIFGSQSQITTAGFLSPQNNFPGTVIVGTSTNQFGIYSITFNTNGFILGGTGLQITNGISDGYGANSNSIPLTLGASQAFQNTSAFGYGTPYLGITYTNSFTNTESGTINLQTNTLTLGGSAPLFLTGVISSTNGGRLVVNNSGALAQPGIYSGVARLNVANTFGTNQVVITNVFTGALTYTATTNYYTNEYVVVGVSTNYYYITNIVSATNGTYTYYTNTYPTVQDAVRVNTGAFLQVNNGSAIPTGAHVGNLFLNGELDVNGNSITLNGLEDSDADSGIIDNVSTANAGIYTVTLGNANSNSLYSGVIQNTSGTLALATTGWGTNTLSGQNSYAGSTTINQGTLAVIVDPTSTLAGTLGSASPLLTIQSGGVLDVSGISGGYYPLVGLSVVAGTPSKPYTNFLGSFDPGQGPTYVVSLTGTNNVFTYVTNTDLANYTNVLITTNFVSLTYSTNTIISIITNDVVGDFNVTGGGAISPATTIFPGIATWSISGNLNIDNAGGFGNNRANFLLNSTTTPGGGTNDLIAVGGNLNIGDELDFVITPVNGTLAAGTYTLMTSHGYTGTGYNSGNPAVLKAVLERGLQGDTIQAAGNNITFTSIGGAAAPGSVIWGATNAAHANWDVALSQNWVTNGPTYPNRDYFYPLDAVTFNDVGFGTVTLPLPVGPGSVTFNNSKTNYTFTASQNSFIVGAANGFVKNGTGTVTLQNPNQLAGNVTVNNGILALGFYAAAANINVLYNGVPAKDLVLGGGELFLASAASSQPDVGFQDLVVNPGASAMYMQGRGANAIPTWDISNNVTRVVGGLLDVQTTGRAGSHGGLFFDGTNSPDGTNDFGTNGIVGAWATYNESDWLYANTTFTVAQGGAMYYPNYQEDNNPAHWNAASNVLVGLSSGNPLTISVPSSQTIFSLRFTNAASSTINIGAGQTLTLASGGLLSPAASAPFPNVISGGTLEGAAGKDLIILNQNVTPTSSTTINSVIADNGTATGLTIGGGGTTILTGNNTYTGPTYINAGYALANSGTLQIGAAGTSGSIASSSAVIDNANLAFNRSDNTSVSGAISGFGNLKKLGAGVLTLTANNTLSGVVTITAGTLQLGNAGASGSISNASSVVDNATLVFDNNNTVSYPGTISGYGSLVQFGTGNLIITNTDTYSGNTTVSNGTVTLAASGSIGNTAQIAVNSGALLDVSAQAGGGLTLRSTSPAEVLTGNGTINGSITTASGTILDVIPGVNGVTGTLTINNNLTLAGGSYKFDVGNTSHDLINVGGSLNENAGTVAINVFGGNLSAGLYPLIHTTAANLTVGLVPNVGLFGFVQSGYIGVLTNDTTSSLSLLVYPGTIPAVTWSGDGAQNIWDLTSSNWTNNPPGGAAVTYANPDYSTIDDSGSAAPAIKMNIAATPTLVTINSTNQAYTIGVSGNTGKITGGAELIKNGTTNLTLLTANDYLGGTIISAGTVQLGDNTLAADDGLVGVNSFVAISNNAELLELDFTNETLSSALSGSGSLVALGKGNLTLTANNQAFSGSIWFSNILQMGNGVNGTLGSGNVTNNRALLFDAGPTPVSTVVVAANITGSGNVTNIGLGVIQLTGSNTYAGNTLIDNGTIRVASSNAIPATTALILDANNSPGTVGTFDLNGYSVSVASLQGNNTGNGAATLVEPAIVNNGTGIATLAIGGGGNTTYNGQLLDNNNGGTGQLALLITNDTTLTLNACYNNASTPVNTYPNLFTGGILVSNASLILGTYAGTSPANPGGAAAGNGLITLAGGNGSITNGQIGWPTNAMLYGDDANGTGNTTVNPTTLVGGVYVPAGQSGTIFEPQRGTMTFTLTGSGTVLMEPDYVRGQFGGDWSGFTGTVIFQGLYNPGGAGENLVLAGPLGLPNAYVFIHTNNNLGTLPLTGANGGNVYPLGALAGGDSSSQMGGGTVDASDGTANTIWAIGGLNLSTTNGSQFVDGGCGVRKVGTGLLVLTNNTMSFGGQLVISNGTLAFAPLGTNASGTPINYLTNTTYLVGSNVTIVSPGILNLSQVGDSHTLYIGHNNSQTLYGNGELIGNLIVSNNNNVVAPGYRAGNPAIYSGSQLTVTGNMIVNSNATFRMSINSTTSPTYDSLAVGGTFTIKSAALVVTNVGPAAFPAGTSNVFRFFPGAVPVTFGAGVGITNITLPALTAGEYYVTNLTLDGSVALVNTNASLNAGAPNVQAVVTGSTLTLGWPTNLGWILQAQTNLGTVGLTPMTNWYDIAGSATVTNKAITIDPTQPAVFYRMRNPSAPVQ